MLRPLTRRLRALLPWAVGPLLGLAAAWAVSRPPIPAPLAPIGGVRLVFGPPTTVGSGTPNFVVKPAEDDPRFVVPKSTAIDPQIVVWKSADVDPRVVAAAPAGPRGR